MTIAGKASRESTRIDTDAVDPAAEVAGEHAQRPADEESDEDARAGDRERDPGAVDAPGEHVAADAVGAEPEFVARSEGEVARTVDACGVVADERQVVGEHGEEDHRQQPGGAEQHAERRDAASSYGNGDVRARRVGHSAP